MRGRVKIVQQQTSVAVVPVVVAETVSSTRADSHLAFAAANSYEYQILVKLLNKNYSCSGMLPLKIPNFVTAIFSHSIFATQQESLVMCQQFLHHVACIMSA